MWKIKKYFVVSIHTDAYNHFHTDIHIYTFIPRTIYDEPHGWRWRRLKVQELHIIQSKRKYLRNHRMRHRKIMCLKCHWRSFTMLQLVLWSTRCPNIDSIRIRHGKWMLLHLINAIFFIKYTCLHQSNKHVDDLEIYTIRIRPWAHNNSLRK